MKTIKLNAPRMIDGVLRHPAEGPLSLPDTTVDMLVGAGAGSEIGDDGEVVEAEDDLDSQTLPDLTIIVTKEGVPLNGATKKNDIIAAIREHRLSKG